MARNYNDMPLIKERVKAVLKEKHLTQLQLADALLINKDYLNKCLRTGRINEETLIYMGEYLDCHPLYFSDESVSRLSYENYEFTSESFRYDSSKCVKALLSIMLYSPADYSKSEIEELKNLIFRTIDKYSILHNKPCKDIAFWDGEGDSSAVVTFGTKETAADNTDGNL